MMKKFHISLLLQLLFMCNSLSLMAQTATISGRVMAAGKPLGFSNVGLLNTTKGDATDSLGHYVIKNVPAGTYQLKASGIGYQSAIRTIKVTNAKNLTFNFELIEEPSQLDEVVVTGTLKEVSRLESPVPVEVFTPKFFQKKPHSLHV